MAAKNKRTFDTIHDEFVLRDTDLRKKMTTGDSLFGNMEMYE